MKEIHLQLLLSCIPFSVSYSPTVKRMHMETIKLNNALHLHVHETPFPMRSILALFPIFFVSLFLLGTTRLAIETFSSAHQTCHDKEFAIAFHNGCNVFDGRWVLEEPSLRPLYTEDTCPYLTRQVTCGKNGRPDALYQKWRWKPHGCHLPSFDAVALLRRLRNKRLMFVGDSVQRTQWESMVCLLQSSAPENRKLVYRDPPRKVFFAKDFNASVEFYWAPFMVESNSDHATKHRVQRRVVRLDAIAKHSRRWEGVDVLVFESYIWWMYKPLINAT